MARRNEAAVLDIGSSKVTVLVGERGINNTFLVKGTGECEYSGFSGGEFYEPEKLPAAISAAIRAAESSVKYRIRELHVGVPGEFSTAVCREASMAFRGRRKVTDLDVDELFKSADVFGAAGDYNVINRTPVYYVLDGDNRIVRPEGHSASRMAGFLCFMLAENKFISFMDKLFAGLGIKNVSYVSAPLAETLFLFDPETRDRFVFLIDIGYITTNLIIARGDGILYLKTIPLGGGHISADLSECLKIGFSQGEALKRRIELSLEAAEGDTYDINVGGEQKSFESALVHKIAAARLEDIADYIKQCIKECPYPFPEYIPIHLTGGGISYMRGAKEHLSRLLGRPVEVAVPSVPQVSKPHLSSVYGVLDYALNLRQPPRAQGFFSKLFFGQ